MTLLTVVNDVCAAVGVHQTTAVIANINENRTMFEMLANANEMAERIAADTREWTELRTTQTLVGSDAIADFNNSAYFTLPTNFRRLLMSSNVWRSTNTLVPLRFIPDFDEWIQRRNANYASPWGEWIIYRGQLHIAPALAPTQTVRFSYLDKQSINITNGRSERFTADTDTFRLPERLLKLGMIVNWKQLKGSPYAEDMGTYQDALMNAMGTDSPSPIFIGRKTISGAMTSATYPFDIPDGMTPI